MLGAILIILSHSFSAQASQCLDSMNLNSDKWKTTKLKIQRLKDAAECAKDIALCEGILARKVPSTSATMWNLFLPSANASAVSSAVSTALGKVTFVFSIAEIDPDGTSCFADNQSKYAQYKKGCGQPLDPYDDVNGFLPNTLKFLDAKEVDQARELLTHPEYCDVILSSYEKIYPEISLQCGDGKLTLSDFKNKSLKKLVWNNRDEILWAEDSDLYDPLQAFKIGFQGDKSDILQFIKPEVLTMGSRNRPADFDKTKSYTMIALDWEHSPSRIKNRMLRLFPRWADLFKMKSCCQKKPLDPQRCAEVLPKKRMLATEPSSQTK
ncbi:MAG: hypothetical protein SGJ18_03925 [Pseudomonadota bacterium]|nr:hypothetical protein [Pseudomonadota bacterium]